MSPIASSTSSPAPTRHAPAAYSIKDTQGNTLTIQAKFSRNNPNIQTAEVRAIDGTFNPPPSGCLGIIYQMFQALMEALFGNVLGEVKGKKVTFLQNGQTNFETFELQNVRLWTLGIGIHVVNWRWQYRLQPNDPWTDFGTTLHRIYCLLETPKAPWVQTPYNAGNTQLPWTEVLDYACQWAYWSGSLDDAAAAVTRNVYGLGPNVVTYDCPGGGSSHYSGGSFDCTAFLERLHGGMGNGQYVNCSDCATFLSTFANILGCDLWQSQMASWFELNAILAIGSNVWQTACGWAHFSYHEVAWKNACTSNDEVFDACLQVDGDADPTQPPHTPLLPIWIAGTAAMLVDSLLGATMEGRRRWMTNDAVNLLATTAGASLAAVLGGV